MLKKSKGNRFHQQGFIFSTFPINFIICLTPYRKASVTGAFFIQESEDDMGVRVVFPDMGKDPSVQLIEKTITENGTYDAITDGANGYSKVNVNVGGGGGSSDFSTANVTITNNSDTDWQTQFASLENIGVGEHPDVIVCNTQGISAKSMNDYKIIMYKNYTGLRSQSTATVEVSGNAELIGRVIAITGDCTITIS